MALFQRKTHAGFFLVVAFFCTPAVGQSVTGINGLISIPTAEIRPDGTVTVGAGHVGRKYTDYMDGAYDFKTFSASIVFLPFLETAFRFSRADSPEPQALGDRMLMVKARLLKEGAHTPAVAVGVHDFLKSSDNETNNFNAVYITATRHFQPRGVETGVHLGFGSNIMSAKHHQFVGLFGGISVRPLNPVEILAEYDGRVFSTGTRVELFRTVNVLVAVQQFSSITGAVSVHTRL